MMAARQMREDSAIEAVYQKYENSCGGIDRQHFPDALCDIGSGHADTAQVDELFDNMDVNEDGLLDLEEFRRAASSRSQFELFIASTIPFAELLSYALPRLKGRSQMNIFMELTERQIADISEALSSELNSIISETVTKLKSSDAAAQSSVDSSRSGSAAEKYSLDTISAGDITDYHKGFSNRVGNSDHLFFLMLVFMDLPSS